MSVFSITRRRDECCAKICWAMLERRCSCHRDWCFWLSTLTFTSTTKAVNFRRPPNYWSIYWIRRSLLNSRSAEKCLSSFVIQGILFSSFWPTLLADTIPLLESKEPQFSSQETYTILHHLENQLVPLIEKQKSLLASGQIPSINLLNDCRIENINDIVRLIRLACARNLARALIIEKTVIV